MSSTQSSPHSLRTWKLFNLFDLFDLFDVCLDDEMAGLVLSKIY